MESQTEMHELELHSCSFGFSEASQTRQLFKAAALHPPIPTTLPSFLSFTFCARKKVKEKEKK